MSTPARPAEVAALNDASVAKPTATLIDAARRLVEARERLAGIRATLDARSTAFAEENAWLMEDKRAASDAIDAAEADVRTLTHAHFMATGKAKPMPGIEVKLFKVLRYDPNAALEWAREKRMALTPERLDVKAFEAIANATDLDFVARDSDARVQIGKVIEVPDAPSAPSSDAELDELFGGAE